MSYAEPLDFARFWCLPEPLCGEDEATITTFLNIASSDVDAARAAQGAYDCTLASWAAEYLKKLVVVEAAVFHNCPCGSARLSDQSRAAFLQWVTQELSNIRTGKLELCDGETAAEFPYVAWAEQSLTPWAAAQIVMNRISRTGS